MVKTGETIETSGHYKYEGHVHKDEETLECTPLPAEKNRYFTKGIKAHGLVACSHDVHWSKSS